MTGRQTTGQIAKLGCDLHLWGAQGCAVKWQKAKRATALKGGLSLTNKLRVRCVLVLARVLALVESKVPRHTKVASKEAFTESYTKTRRGVDRHRQSCTLQTVIIGATCEPIEKKSREKDDTGLS